MPNFTTEWLQNYERKHKAGDKLQNPVPQCVVRDESLGQDAGKEKGTGRAVVSITSLRSRLIDPDNLCPKYVVDAARYVRLIDDDSAAHIEFRIIQRKVAKGRENHPRNNLSMSTGISISAGPRDTVMARILLPLPLKEATAIMKAMGTIARKRGKQAVCFQEGEFLVFEEREKEKK
jgi:hypothetical protein